jgi:hypothetical protein
VKGAKRLGVRIGNWLTVDQTKALLRESPSHSVRSKRDRAILALLIECGLRRAELVGLRTEDFQVREEHSVIADLVGKGKHIRTVPVPVWAKRAVDEWTAAAGINGGAIFRRVSRMDKIWGDRITPKAIWHVVKAAAKHADIKNLARNRKLAQANLLIFKAACYSRLQTKIGSMLASANGQPPKARWIRQCRRDGGAPSFGCWDHPSPLSRARGASGGRMMAGCVVPPAMLQVNSLRLRIGTDKR